MTLKILNELHPLIEAAWLKGFDAVIADQRVLVKDALPASNEDPVEREQSRLALEEGMQSQAADIAKQLASLDKIKVQIDSRILGERIWIVGRKALLSELPPGAVGYLPQEVIRIKKAKWSDETLRKMHRIKKVFGGDILDIEEKRTGGQ